MSFRLHALRLAALAMLASLPQAAKAAEGGAGAYVLGLRGPAAGVTPPPGIFFSNQLYFYRGDAGARIPFEGGPVVANGRAEAAVNIATLIGVTSLELFGGRLGFSVTAPYGHVDISGRVGPFGISDDATALGDPSISTFLGWQAGNFHWQLGFTGFIPVGHYRSGRLANVAKNRGAVDLFATLTWLDRDLGLDISNAVGVTFNRENDVTRYRTGNEFHWEWAVIKRFENGFSFGPAGYHYQQISDDGGAGARLGGFRGSAWAAGATVGYEFQVGQVPVTARLRWFHEIETERRLRGDAVFVGLSLPLYVPGR